MTITITADHLHAATVHERALIVDWLRSITDPDRVESFKLDDDTITTIEILNFDGTAGAHEGKRRGTDRREMSYPVGPNCPHVVLHDLWARLEPDDTDHDLRVRDALADFADRYGEDDHG